MCSCVHGSAMSSWEALKKIASACKVRNYIPRHAEQASALAAQSLAELGEWFFFEFVSWLWGQDIVVFARASLSLRRLAARHWRRALVHRGFAATAAVALSLEQTASLERWGGQGWDAWHRVEGLGGVRLTLVRHWRSGTTILLNGDSTGWFEFQTTNSGSCHTFYSDGTTEANQDGHACLAVAFYPWRDLTQENAGCCHY
mmetsp:Transcript_27807/g.54653  ORF Transcript_27807/g.54653 Transcript_27807/m.54653 type:complete len:201 (+) Transcript_27807:870-1472(+)